MPAKCGGDGVQREETSSAGGSWGCAPTTAAAVPARPHGDPLMHPPTHACRLGGSAAGPRCDGAAPNPLPPLPPPAKPAAAAARPRAARRAGWRRWAGMLPALLRLPMLNEFLDDPGQLNLLLGLLHRRSVLPTRPAVGQHVLAAAVQGRDGGQPATARCGPSASPQGRCRCRQGLQRWGWVPCAPSLQANGLAAVRHPNDRCLQRHRAGCCAAHAAIFGAAAYCCCPDRGRRSGPCKWRLVPPEPLRARRGGDAAFCLARSLASQRQKGWREAAALAIFKSLVAACLGATAATCAALCRRRHSSSAQPPAAAAVTAQPAAMPAIAPPREAAAAAAAGLWAGAGRLLFEVDDCGWVAHHAGGIGALRLP